MIEQGYKIKGFPFWELELVEFKIISNILILAHQKNKKEEHYLSYFVDEENDLNRWILFKISEKDLDFVEKNKSLKELIFSSNEIYIIDFRIGTAEGDLYKIDSPEMIDHSYLQIIEWWDLDTRLASE